MDFGGNWNKLGGQKRIECDELTLPFSCIPLFWSAKPLSWPLGFIGGRGAFTFRLLENLTTVLVLLSLRTRSELF